MHILYFHQHFSTPKGSTATRSYEMSQALLRKGHKVTVVCGSYSGGQTGLDSTPIRGKRRGDVDGISVIEICLPYSNNDSLVKRSMTFLRFAAKSVAIACRTDYDLLFATSTPLTAGIPGVLMRLIKPSRPFIFEVRDLWPELPKAMGVITNPIILGAMSALEWLSYRCASGCIGLSPGIVDGIQRRSPKSKRVIMIPNGCDLDLFRPRTETDAARPNELNVAFTGAHGMANGLDAALDAAEVLKKRGEKRIHLHFIGSGKLKPALMKRVQEAELENCHFRDPVPKHSLSEIMLGMDVGMMILANVPAFYYGTSPNKFFDYIAAGLPVLNNYPGWLADLISEHACGLAVPPDNPELFADALVKLADSPDLRDRMGKKSRALAEAEFDRKKLAALFVGVFEEIASFDRHH